MNKIDYPIVTFKNQQEWERWLKEHYASTKGVWVKFAKKGSGIVTVAHQEVLAVALCYGWIDGQAKGVDETYWLVKFTPRGPKSMWSKRNRDIVEQLITENKMQPAGLEKVEAAKKDGRWEQAYDSQKNMVIPKDLLEEIKKDKKKFAFFSTLNKSNLYAIVWRLQTAKRPETRDRRMKQILETLARGEKFH
jgi:uncharacterized protein YdeI (YjbR/CyaY-like superfamily)